MNCLCPAINIKKLAREGIRLDLTLGDLVEGRWFFNNGSQFRGH